VRMESMESMESMRIDEGAHTLYTLNTIYFYTHKLTLIYTHKLISLYTHTLYALNSYSSRCTWRWVSASETATGFFGR
jgi:hypothetical protein